MRRKILLSLLCIGLFTLNACGKEATSQSANEMKSAIATESADEKESVVEESTEKVVEKENTELAATTETETEKQEENEAKVDYSCYYRHIEQVARGVELGFPDDYVMDLEAEFAVCIRFPATDTQYGYLLRDLNGDGIDELIFGANGPESCDGTIYDIYTIKDGGIVSTVIAWDREQYYLCKNGAIAYESDGGAGSFSYSYYDYIGQVLRDDLSVGLRERVLYDGIRDMNNPWFHSGAGIVDFDAATPITEEEANTIMDSYEYERLVFTPFGDGATF